MLKRFKQLLCASLIVISFSGCDAILSELNLKTGPAPVEEMLPTLADYDTVEGETLTDYISNLSEGAALLAGQPELVATIAVVDHIITCYQEVGAAKARIYSNEDMPLSAGVIAIADRNELLNPVNLFKCVKPAVDMTGAQAVEIQPCSATYTLEKDDNEFYIIYAGTTEDICKTFCANLEGCTEHK